MPIDAKNLFESGNRFADQGQWDEALKSFTQVIQIVSDNAEYYAGLARVWNGKGEYAKAIDAATQAIRIDAAYSGGYVRRAIAYWSQNKPEQALTDCDKALKFDSHYAVIWLMRSIIYESKGNLRGAISDRAHFYEIETKSSYTDSVTDDANTIWYQIIHKHFTTFTLPRVKSNGEKFVEYWPCYFFWDRKKEVHQDTQNRGLSVTYKYGKYGTGYLCLTDQNIYIFSFGELTGKFPLYKPQGVGGFLGGLLLGNQNQVDREQSEKEDKAWTIPFHNVRDAQLTENKISLLTPAMTWEISANLKGSEQKILVAINMGKSGELTALWQPQPATTLSGSSQDIPELLKKLVELKASGVITEAEFDQKKKELLSRL